MSSFIEQESILLKQDEKHFNYIINSFQDDINKICRSFSSNLNEVDDLRQDVLINIWKGLNSFQNNSKLRTWIYRVSINTCVSSYRYGKKKHEVPEIINFEIS